jgi:nucleoside-diphosphate-sugar epimerase
MKNDQTYVALITGVTGYIGSNLALRLLDLGWEVHAIVRGCSISSLIEGDRENIKFHIDDGAIDSMMKIMSAVQPTVVFHLASLFLSSHSSNDIKNLLNSNIEFGLRLIESMDKSNIRNIVNTGTSWQNYDGEAYSPTNLYAATKEAFDCLLKYYQLVRGINAITLKLFDSYGPGDKRGKLVSMLLKAAKDGNKISMSPGYQEIDLVYIDDIVDCYILAAIRLMNKSVHEHEVYGVSSNNPITLRDLVEKVSIITKSQILIDWGGRPYREREVMRTWKNSKKMPNWSPKVELDQGILMCMS